jgi:hypothetical protein
MKASTSAAVAASVSAASVSIDGMVDLKFQLMAAPWRFQ